MGNLHPRTPRMEGIMPNRFTYWTRQLFQPGTVLREKYDAFKSLLRHDKAAHDRMAELEDIYYRQAAVDFEVVKSKYAALSEAVGKIAADLAAIHPGPYDDLRRYWKKFDDYVAYMIEPTSFSAEPPFVLGLREVDRDASRDVGGKAAALADLIRRFDAPVPPGFVLTTAACNRYLAHNNLRAYIDEQLAQLDIYDGDGLRETSARLTAAVREGVMPPELEEAALAAFDERDGDARVAVRSSAVEEDSGASFAGQYQSILDVDRAGLADAYREVLAGQYSPEALYYRVNFGRTDAETPMAALVMEMIPARVSGVMYTGAIRDQGDDRIHIHTVRGAGEKLVSGRETPEIAAIDKSRPDEVAAAPPGIDRDLLRELAEWGRRLESDAGRALDIEWCQDESGRLYLLQSRPLQIEAAPVAGPVECDFDEVDHPVLLSAGETAAGGIGAGDVHHAGPEETLDAVPENAVLVAGSASPRYVQIIHRLSAVVAEKGSAAGHFASVAREFGVPTLVNVPDARQTMPAGGTVTVNAETGTVYEGAVEALLNSPCARRNLLADSPFMRRLGYVMEFVSPLRLTDPEAENFTPEGCRSFHDIIRFAHEKAMQEMFHVGDPRTRKVGGAKKLRPGIPMLFYVIDVGGGLSEAAAGETEVTADAITSRPMRAVLKGMRHPDIHWGYTSHFDWEKYDRVVMSGAAVASPESAMFASHAVISADYANLSLRFGYHFVIVDALCADMPGENYALLRFSGGGADLEKRHLRARFLTVILSRLGFEVTRKSDLVDASFKEADTETMVAKLDWLGRLLGATRLMDMYLKDESMVDEYAEEFMRGRYHFASVSDEEG